MNSLVADRFGPRARSYARYRPGYPAQLRELLESRASLTRGDAVADVGSGTGLSAAMLLGRGWRVYAVEPSPPMRAEAEAAYGHLPDFCSVSGTAEATTLDGHSVRLVTVGTAFHWFDQPATRREFARILTPGGRVAIFWNRRLDGQDGGPGADFARDYAALLGEYTDYRQSTHRDHQTSAALEPFFGAPPEEAHLPSEQRLDFEGLRNRLISASYAPLPESPRYLPLVHALRCLFDRYAQDGAVTLRYDTCVFHGVLE